MAREEFEHSMHSKRRGSLRIEMSVKNILKTYKPGMLHMVHHLELFEVYAAFFTTEKNNCLICIKIY